MILFPSEFKNSFAKLQSNSLEFSLFKWETRKKSLFIDFSLIIDHWVTSGVSSAGSHNILSLCCVGCLNKKLIFYSLFLFFSVYYTCVT